MNNPRNGLSCAAAFRSRANADSGGRLHANEEANSDSSRMVARVCAFGTTHSMSMEAKERGRGGGKSGGQTRRWKPKRNYSSTDIAAPAAAFLPPSAPHLGNEHKR